MLLAAFTFDLDPVLLDFGSFQVRYYGAIFAATLGVVYLFWRWQMRRGGYDQRITSDFMLWGVVATVVGARLGHFLFYEPQMLLQDPFSLLKIWHGGLASHGALVGLTIALVLFARRHKLRLLEVMDRFAFSAAVGAAGIRLGNFLNSEILGRPADVPWAVIFPRADVELIPRHPSQLYEFALGLAILGALVLVDRLAGKEKRPLGLLTGVFLTLYFAGRFCVEFFKDIQEAWERDLLLTQGQMLSVVPFLAGAALLAWALTRRCPTDEGKIVPIAAEPAAGRGKGGRKGSKAKG